MVILGAIDARAISGVGGVLGASEHGARRTLRIGDAFEGLRRLSVLIKPPGWAGFFMGIAGFPAP